MDRINVIPKGHQRFSLRLDQNNKLCLIIGSGCVAWREGDPYPKKEDDDYFPMLGLAISRQTISAIQSMLNRAIDHIEKNPELEWTEDEQIGGPEE